MIDKGLIIDKYLGNAEKGYKAALSKDYKVFGGFPETLKSRLGVTLSFDDESTRMFADIVERINKVATESGAEIFMAGKNYPIHATLMEINNPDGEITTETSALLSGEIAKESFVDDFRGEKIQFNYPFVDSSGNVMIAATNIPETVLEARSRLGDIGIEAGLKPIFLDNILHISTARLLKLPEDFNNYYRLPSIRPVIRKGLTMTVEKVSVKNSYDFLTGR